jgi:hypothetical protein
MKVSLKYVASIAVFLHLTGCSLISVKSPERPLSQRDLNARILTREFSHGFIIAVRVCADEISTRDTDPAVRTNALRWKLGATSASLRAANQMAPMMGLLDTWALSAQMQQFLSPAGAGHDLFGKQQGAALSVATSLNQSSEALAHYLVTRNELTRYQKFVEAYVRDHPLQGLDFERTSVVALWAKESGENARLVDSLGTIPEAITDVSDRLQMYGDALPDAMMWKAELAVQGSEYSGHDVQLALGRIDSRLSQIADASENAPQLVHSAIADTRKSALDVINRLDTISAQLVDAFQSQRVALTEDVRKEGEALSSEASNQRAAIARDVSAIADRVVRTSGQEMRYLVREALLLTIVLAAVVLGLPFAAGYLLGRARAKAQL